MSFQFWPDRGRCFKATFDLTSTDRLEESIWRIGAGSCRDSANRCESFRWYSLLRQLQLSQRAATVQAPGAAARFAEKVSRVAIRASAGVTRATRGRAARVRVDLVGAKAGAIFSRHVDHHRNPLVRARYLLQDPSSADAQAVLQPPSFGGLPLPRRE